MEVYQLSNILRDGIRHLALLSYLAYRWYHEAGSFFRVLMASRMPSHPPLCLVSTLSSYLNRIGVYLVLCLVDGLQQM